jgi:mannosyltransferase
MTNINNFFRSKAVTYYYILFLMLLVFAISYFFLLPQSLRLDESQSIWQANRPFKDLLEVSARDVHVPLYNTILHYWIEFFGNNIFTNRLMSIPMSFALSVQANRHNHIGVYLATIFSISPFMMWFGSELRMYSMFVFFTLAAHFWFIKIMRSTKPIRFTWLLYLVTLILGIYTHYFFGLFIICQFFFYIFNRKVFPRGSFLKFIIIAISIVCSILPWLMYVRYINTAGSQTPLLTKPSTVDLFNVYSNQFFGFQVDSINSLILASWPLVGVLCLYFLQKRIVYNLDQQREQHHKHEAASELLSSDYVNIASKVKPYQPNDFQPNHKIIGTIIPRVCIYYTFMAFVPTLFLFIISISFRPVFLSRYLIMCLFPIYFVVVSVVFSYRSLMSNLLKLTLVVIISLGLIVQTQSPDVTVKEDYREAINYVISTSKESDIIAISPPFTIYPFYYYYNGDSPLVTIPQWDLTTGIPPFDQDKLNRQFDGFNTKYSKVYIILSYDQGYETKVKETADSKFSLDYQKNFSPKLNLYVYDTKVNSR